MQLKRLQRKIKLKKNSVKNIIQQISKKNC